MNSYLAAATTTNTNTAKVENLYQVGNMFSVGVLGKLYKNKGMAIMQATNAARREGKTLTVIG